MPQFTRPTIVAAVRMMDRWWHSNITSFLLDHGLEHVALGGSVETRVTALIHHLLDNPDAMTDGENLVEAVVRDLVERAADVASRRSEDFAERYPKLVKALARDGFVVEAGKLRRALPESVDLPAADDEVHELLKRFGFTVSMAHLDQAIDTHSRGQWESANGQIRSFYEGLVNDIAEKLAQGSALPPKGGARLSWLAQQSDAFVLAGLSEWDGQGRGFFEALYRRLHPGGPHPGLSDKDDCTFRLHTVLVVGRLLLRRLAARP